MDYNIEWQVLIKDVVADSEHLWEFLGQCFNNDSNNINE